MWALLGAEGDTSIWQNLSSFAPIIFIVIFGYILLMRPAQAQEKKRRALVAALKKNDKIVNSGGIIGIVDSVKDDEVVLRGGLRLTKSSIVQVLKEDAAKE
jgi:preprotein translocase subunit YajC